MTPAAAPRPGPEPPGSGPGGPRSKPQEPRSGLQPRRPGPEQRRPGSEQRRSGSEQPRVIPSPNIWSWPDVYERENRAQDAGGAIWRALRAACPWEGADVADVGCGDGFHLPVFAASAATVTGVEPVGRLVARARERVAALPNVEVRVGHAQATGLAAASADLVHARTAYFFGPGCEPGMVEADRVLRPGGALAIVDLDGTAGPYGAWMRAAVPSYDPSAARAFFERHGFTTTLLDTVWRFEDRESLEAVLRIEFSPPVAARAAAETTGLTIPVRYRLHLRRRERLLLPR